MRDNKVLKEPKGSTLHIDKDVQIVLEFMSLNIKTSKCIKVANVVQQLAPIVFQPSIDEHNYAEGYYIPMVFIPPTG